MKRIGIAGSIGMLGLIACSASSSGVEGQGGGSNTGGSSTTGGAAGSGNQSSGGAGNASSGGSGNASSGGSGNANSGGTAGVTGTGGSTQGTGGATIGSTQVELKYASRSPASSNFVLPHITLENKVIYSVPLNEVEIRYYWTLTGESTSTQNFTINNARVQNPIGGAGYVNLGANGQTVITVVPMPTPTATADHYVSITFNTNPPVLLRMTDIADLILDDYTQDKVTQSNDYSFKDSGGADTPVVWDHIAVYRNGELVWGVPPS